MSVASILARSADCRALLPDKPSSCAHLGLTSSWFRFAAAALPATRASKSPSRSSRFFTCTRYRFSLRQCNPPPLFRLNAVGAPPSPPSPRRPYLHDLMKSEWADFIEIEIQKNVIVRILIKHSGLLRTHRTHTECVRRRFCHEQRRQKNNRLPSV